MNESRTSRSATVIIMISLLVMVAAATRDEVVHSKKAYSSEFGPSPIRRDKGLPSPSKLGSIVSQATPLT